MTLYELLCGYVPFAGPLEVVIFHTLNTPPPPLRDDHPDIPAELERICLKSLSKKPEDRYATCREMARDLGRWLAGRTTSQEVAAQSVIATMIKPGNVQQDTAPLSMGSGLSALVVDD